MKKKECQLILPQNGRGYPLEVEDESIFLYRSDQGPWCIEDLDPSWRIVLDGYYWTRISGKPTLILGYPRVKGWSWSRWRKLRALWALLVQTIRPGFEDLGFSFSDEPQEFFGWLCVSPRGVGVGRSASCSETLARLAFQYERLVPGASAQILGQWKDLQFNFGKILRNSD